MRYAGEQAKPCPNIYDNKGSGNLVPRGLGTRFKCRKSLSFLDREQVYEINQPGVERLGSLGHLFKRNFHDPASDLAD